MSARHTQAPVWAIWLLIAAAAIQPLIWRMPSRIPARPGVFVLLLIVWLTMIVFAGLATRRLSRLSRTVSQESNAHETTLKEIEQLQTQSAMLDLIARSAEVPLAFQELASRIERLVPCDRVGLALLTDDGRDFHTYTARAEPSARRGRSLPEVTFKVERTLIGNVVRSREPFIGDMQEAAADHVDANVVATAGFRSALILPLISTDRAVGTLSVVSRRRNAFDRSHIGPLQPIAQILALGWVVQQMQIGLGRSSSGEEISAVTLTVSSEIHNALQAIVRQCDVLAHAGPDSDMERRLEPVVQQGQKIAELLEKLRASARTASFSFDDRL